MTDTLRAVAIAAMLLAGSGVAALAASEGGSGGPGSGQSVTGTETGHQQTNSRAVGVVTPKPGNGQTTGNPGGHAVQTTTTAATPDAAHPGVMSPSGGGGSGSAK